MELETNLNGSKATDREETDSSHTEVSSLNVVNHARNSARYGSRTYFI